VATSTAPAVIGAIPGVAEVAVIAAPDEKFGGTPAAATPAQREDRQVGNPPDCADVAERYARVR
jgi:hypothetical protein